MSELKYMMITDSPEVAAFVECHGVDRIFMDREVIGKAARQGHLNTHKACHSLEAIAAVAKCLQRAELMVRINPFHGGTAREVEAAIDHGAQRLMLPMFTTCDEVRRFDRLVDGRVPVTYLAETPQALVRMPGWLKYLTPGVDEVHLGLNDLSLGLRLEFLFEPLAGGILDPAASLLKKADITWGMGGVGRVGMNELPAEQVLGEHVRLGSTWVILSRVFHNSASSVEQLLQELDFAAELAALDTVARRWATAKPERLETNRHQLVERVFGIVEPRTLSEVGSC